VSVPGVKPLGTTQRRLLVVLALYRLRAGRAPTWTELARAVRLEGRRNRFELVSRLRALRRRGLVTFVEDEPGSLDVTPRGLQAALGEDGRAGS
jgi:hypothetical protein